MDNSRFLKTVITILLIINIGTLTFMWVHRPPVEGRPPRHDVGEFLSHELNFSNNQENKFNELKKEHHQSTEMLRDKNKLFHDQFFDLMKTNPVDSTKVNSTLDSICSTQKQLELVTFSHFQKIRALCTSDQQKKFDEVIDEALRMMAPKPPPHR